MATSCIYKWFLYYLASDRTILLWDVNTNAFIDAFEKHISGISDISWSGDSQYLASASDDKTIRIWDIRSVFYSNYSLNINRVQHYVF